MRAKLETALQEKDRGRRLQQLETLSTDNAFYELAASWVPVLLADNAPFFEPFLQRHLPRAPIPLLRRLLPQIEEAGRHSLFDTVYPLIANEQEWNEDLIQIATSGRPLADKLAAIRRRDPARIRWYRLEDETARRIYTLAPEQLSSFVQQHVRGDGPWVKQPRNYATLRQAAEDRGDEKLLWHIFRELADKPTWVRELRRLYRAAPPAGTIVAALEKRHPRYLWNVRPRIIIDFVEKYGQAVLPYVDAHLYLVSGDHAGDFLDTLARLDEELYWEYFFRVGTNDQWLAALRTLLAGSVDDEHLQRELQRRLPAEEQRWAWQRWYLDDELALAFYRRDPERFRPFLESFVDQRPFRRDNEDNTPLFQAATGQGDELFLNFLSFVYLNRITALARRQRSPWNRPADTEKERMEQLSALLVERFDRLARSPASYVRHVADIFSRYQAFSVWNFKEMLSENPAFHYLYSRHRPVWWDSAAGITELLESPNIFIQIVGMEILAEGTAAAHPGAARRVLENLPVLRALLLGRAHKSTKRLALQLLAGAARTLPTAATKIVPVLKDTMAHHSRRAISDDIMATYVRLQTESPIPALP